MRKPPSQVPPKLRRRVLAALPTSWLDPILSGPDAVRPRGLRGDWTGADVEQLLLRVRERVVAALGARIRKPRLNPRATYLHLATGSRTACGITNPSRYPSTVNVTDGWKWVDCPACLSLKMKHREDEP